MADGLYFHGSRMRSVTRSTVLIMALLNPWSARLANAAAQRTIWPTCGGQLEQLPGRTGWLRLGDLTLDRRHWASAGDPDVDFMTGGFEFVSRTVDRRLPVLPSVGDLIRLTARNRVIILGYRTTGTQRVVEVPLDHGVGLSPGDDTDVVLTPGTVVKVQQVELRRTESMDHLFVRAAPAPECP